MTANPRAAATYDEVARRLIPFLIVCYFSAYIDRSNIGIAKLQFSADLHITEAMYGLAGGLFYLGYCLFEIPSNLLLRRIGARRTFFRILVLWSLFTAALAFATRPGHVYVLRFLIGAAEAGFFPGVLYYLSQWAPAHRRARFTAWFMSAMAVAGVLGGPLSGLILAAFDGMAGMAGWRWLFLIEGLPGIALGYLALRMLPDSPAQAKWLTEEQKLLIRTELQHDETLVRERDPGNPWAIVRDPRLYLFACMSVALIAGLGGIALWMPTVLRATGSVSPAKVAALTAIPYLCALATQQWLARRSDLRAERLLHVAVPALVSAVAWLLIPSASGQLWTTLLLFCVATGAAFGATGPFWALVASSFVGTRAAVAIATVTTCGGIGAFLSPILVGWAAGRWGATAASCNYYGLLFAVGALSLWLGARHIANASRLRSAIAD